MEAFEFLGGRYNRPEQIISGPVQAFRAQNAVNGRIVFIHRASTTESPEGPAALLKLLSTALVKSSEAKRLVLDFGEEGGYLYVVTESESQCVRLSEWLETEINVATNYSRSGPREAIRVANLATGTSEFTKLFAAEDSSRPRDGATPQTPPLRSNPGEFAKLFNTPNAERKQQAQQLAVPKVNDAGRYVNQIRDPPPPAATERDFEPTMVGEENLSGPVPLPLEEPSSSEVDSLLSDGPLDATLRLVPMSIEHAELIQDEFEAPKPPTPEAVDPPAAEIAPSFPRIPMENIPPSPSTFIISPPQASGQNKNRVILLIVFALLFVLLICFMLFGLKAP